MCAGTELHGHVAIMAAGMHDPVILRCEGQVGLLGDGQRVHVAAQGDALGGIALAIIGVRCLAAYGRDDAGADELVTFLALVLGMWPGNALVGDAELVEIRAYVVARGMLLSGELGMLVEVTPQGDDIVGVTARLARG